MSLHRELKPGLIFDIARSAGIDIPEGRDKVPIRCRFHGEDRKASAFLSVRNVFYCSVCTPNKGWTAKQFAEQIGIDWNALSRTTSGIVAPRRDTRKHYFPADEAARVWEQARRRAQIEFRLPADKPAFDYMRGRGLEEALERGLAGVISPADRLPRAIWWWPRESYRVIAALYGQRGALACIQARRVSDGSPKTKFPTGSCVKGTAFANDAAQSLLRGAIVDSQRVIIGEGLTDFWALSICADVPVISAPGTNFAAPAIGAWVRGRDVLLALDNDQAARNVRGEVACAAFDHGARSVAWLEWPSGANDACDVLAARGSAGLRQFISHKLGELGHE